MNAKEISLLKEGDKVELRGGTIAVFKLDLRYLDYFKNNKVAYIDIYVICRDTDHCSEADNSDRRIHPCYGHREIVWPAQIVKKI